MARITIAQLQAQLDAARTENAQLRQLNADWAHQSKIDKITILKLRDQIATNAPNTMNDADAKRQLIRRYFEKHPEQRAHGVSLAQLREFAKTQHA